MNKLHICFVSEHFPLTRRVSDQISLWPIADRLSEMGHKISIVTHKGPYQMEKLQRGATSIYFVSHEGEFVSVQEFAKKALLKIAGIHKQEPLSHVHSIDTGFRRFKTHFPKTNRPTLSYGTQASSVERMSSLFFVSSDRLSKLLKAHLIYPFYFLKELLLKDYSRLRQAQGVFVNSPRQALSLERYYLYPPNWIFQVPLDALIKDLTPRKKSAELLEKWNIPLDSPIVATASKMTQTSELIFILDAFEKISLNYPKARLIITGNGPYFKQLERAVLMRALDSKVIFTKHVPSSQLPDYIALSDIYINMNNQTSGFGQTLIEAMAQKKVIIGSEFSPIAHMIQNGVNGFLIRPGDTQKCIRLIDQVFNNPSRAIELGTQARTDILKILDKEILTQKTLEAFKRIQDRKSFFSPGTFSHRINS